MNTRCAVGARLYSNHRQHRGVLARLASAAARRFRDPTEAELEAIGVARAARDESGLLVAEHDAGCDRCAGAP